MDFQTPFDNDTLAEALLVTSTLLASRSVFLNRSDLTESLMKEIRHQLPELCTELFEDATPSQAEQTAPEELGKHCESQGNAIPGSADQKCDTCGEAEAQSVSRSGGAAAIGWEVGLNAETIRDRVT
ncbi:hypothetical protein FRC06_005543 [Ceratobasidium sp. 370]|nr:hypothetical protein FRC06_005543 [Ceratobasidium sp. 370]